MVGAEFGLLVDTAPEMTDLYSLDLQEGLAVRTRCWPLLGCRWASLSFSISQEARQLLRSLRQKVLLCFKRRKTLGEIYITEKLTI